MRFPPPSARQASIIWFSLTVLAAAGAVAVLGVVLWGVGLVLTALSSVLWPVAVGVVMAYILDPVVERLVRRGVVRTRAVLLVFAVVATLLAAAAASILPGVVSEAGDLAGRVPELTHKGRARVQRWLGETPEAWAAWLPERVRAWLRPDPSGAVRDGGAAPAPDAGADPGRGSAARPLDSLMSPESLASAETWLASGASNAGRWLVAQLGRLTDWFGFLAGLAVTPLYTFYLLTEKEVIRRRWTEHIPMAESRLKDEVVFVLRSVNDCLVTFVHCQVIVAFFNGIFYGVGFLLIGLPYGLLLGLTAMVVTVVPYVGAFITTIAALAIAVIQFGDWRHPLLVLAVVAVVQFLEGFVVQPKILGDRVGLHPMVTIVAVMTGAVLLGGPLGAALAIPAAATLRVLLSHYRGTGAAAAARTSSAG